MRYRIRHITQYRYDRPVTLGTHVFRMQPHGMGLRSDAFRLTIYPPPASLVVEVGEHGNPVHTATFEGATPELRVSMSAEGETFDAPPLPAAPASLPPFYGDAIESLWKYRVAGVPEGEAAALARAVAGEAEGDAVAFLRGLSRELQSRIRNISRLTGAPHPPEVTLREGKGSCRDFAVLFVACCRHQGLAARFVSGYIPAPTGERQHMHAWAEAHVPGLGWTAWDPTLGGPAGASHIRVAAAAEPADAAPLVGTFFGANDSEMTVELTVETGF